MEEKLLSKRKTAKKKEEKTTVPEMASEMKVQQEAAPEMTLEESFGQPGTDDRAAGRSEYFPGGVVSHLSGWHGIIEKVQRED